MNIIFKTKHFAKNFIWLNQIDSTNSFVKENESILKDKTVVATNHQTKGRGTKKRKFKSVPFKTLAISIFFKEIETFLLPQIPKALTLSAVKTLKQFSINCKIKWFNDILIDDKKIAGILCESKILKNKANLVAGIGINVSSTEKELQNLSLFEAASIFSKTNKEINQEILLKTLIENFEEIFLKFLSNSNQDDFEKLNEKFCENCCTLNKIIKVFNLKTGDIFLAKAINILKNGELLIAHQNKTFPIDYSSYSITQFEF